MSTRHWSLASVLCLWLAVIAAACGGREQPSGEQQTPAAGQQATPAAGEPAAAPAPPPAPASDVPPPPPGAPTALRPAPAPAARPAAGSTTTPAPAPPPALSAGAAAAASSPAAGPTHREVTIPAGTRLPATLETPVSSDGSSLEDTVRARLRNTVRVDGVAALPAGARLTGVVTEATRAARVKGRARLAFRFDRLVAGDESHDIVTSPVSREAQPTKADDAKKIGIGAAAGAIVGGIAGGGKGAAIGAGVGGGAGTGVVMATRGEEVRLGAGTAVTVVLAEPLTVRVPVER